MSGFLDRNKRKSALAALGLLLPRLRNAAIVLLLAIAAVHFAFGFGVQGSPAPAASFASGEQAAPALRDAVLAAPPAAAEGRTIRAELDAASYSQSAAASYDREQESSFRLVQGIPLDARSGSFSASVDALLPKPRDIGGIATPEEADKIESGVPLSERELKAGLARNAPVGEAAARAEKGADEGGLADGGPAPKGRALSPGQSLIPDGSSGFAAADAGRLSSFGYSPVGTRAGRGGDAAVAAPCAGEGCSNYKLAQALAYSCTAAPGGTSCPSRFNHCVAGVCPAEYASNTSGAPFEGGSASGTGLLVMPNEPVPLTPDAQPLLSRQYAVAERQLSCVQKIGQGNAQVAAANDTFAGCCGRMESSWQACASGCSANATCILNCSNIANAASQQCESALMSTYQSAAVAQDASSACGAGTAKKAFVQDSPWSMPFHCVRH